MVKLSGAGFCLLTFMTVIAFIVYIRMWSVESDLDLNNDKVDRMVFEQVQSEALDEAAEWRKKYDEEAEKSGKYAERIAEGLVVFFFVFELAIRSCATLSKVNRVLANKNQQLETLNTHVEDIQKENQELLKEVERLKQELRYQKLKCGNSQTKDV
eukprot:TRINITY_DN14536_c0_g1_i3.p1 TRINITY_DN14536_c0_g1~~TRINITY_DN14536_c0_g1_i3.p1  ORF type:complete len:156 (+),score=22.23 TRINITY_DN14536_c0_g1_i3:177-644(+)